MSGFVHFMDARLNIEMSLVMVKAYPPTRYRRYPIYAMAPPSLVYGTKPSVI
jgi:hypothetical protein